MKVKILIEGYDKEIENGLIASPSTVLIKNNNLNILVDPGSNKKLLLEALSKENLKPEDIDLIFITHYHLDHVLNVRLFPNKKVLDGFTIYDEDKFIWLSKKEIPGTKIKIIETPGHSPEHASLLVETEKGKIVIAGDLFWWLDKEEQKTDYESLINKKDVYANDMDALIKSRKKIFEIADYIIPGHGKMFKVGK